MTFRSTWQVMQKPMLLMLFTLNTWGIRVTSPWHVVQALGPRTLM